MAELAQDPGGSDRIRRKALACKQGAVMLLRLRPLAARHQEISDALARHEPFRGLLAEGGEGRHGLPVEADRVLVGVELARPVPGRRQVARAPGPIRRLAEMMAEKRQFLEPFRIVAIAPLERLGDRRMDLGTAPDEKVVVDHLVEQRLHEAVGLGRPRAARRRLLDDLRVAKSLEAGFDPGRIGGNGGKQVRIETRPDDGGAMDEAPHLLRQPIDAREHHRLDADGNVDARLALAHLPARLLAPEDIEIDEAADDLLDEERIAAGACEDPVAEVLRQASLAEEGRKEALAIGGRERPEPKRGDAGARRCQALGAAIGALRGDEHQRRPLQPVEHEAQCLERGRVRPMQILDDKEERRPLEAALEYDADEREELAAELLGLDVPQRPFAIAEAEDVEQERHPFLHLGRSKADLHKTRRETFLRRLRRVARRYAVGAAQHGGERPIGRLAERRAGGAPYGHVLEARILGDSGEEFADEARLADAGIADELDELRRAAAGERQAVPHAADFPVASDQRRAEAEGVEPPGGPRRFQRSHHAMNLQAAGLAAERDGAERLIGEGMPRELMGDRPDEYLLRTGHRLQPLRRVHGIAGDRIGFGVAGAEGPSHHRTGIDADMEAQRQADPLAPALAHPSRPADHLQRCAKRPFRGVLMGDRRAEKGEQRVADELVDEAAEGLDGFGQFLEELVLQRLQDFRVDPLAEAGEAAEVREDDGDRAAVGAGVGAR